MRAWVAVVLAGGVALAAPPSLRWKGKLSWTFPVAAPTWSSTVAVRWSVSGWQATAQAVLTDGAWAELTLSGSVTLGEGSLSSSLSFAPQGPAFRGLTLHGKLAAGDMKGEGIARLEEDGFGWGLTLVGPDDALIQRVRLRFNLKRYLDEVLEDTFAPSFSFGEVRFQVALPCCVDRLRGWVNFTKEGFSDLGVSFPLPLPRETRLTLFSVVRFSVDKKTAFLGPGLSYELPPCVEAFLGLDWDPPTATVRGIKVYAVGWRCELGAVRVRSLTVFEDIGLIKRPYGEALWITWEGSACCGPVRAAMAAYSTRVGGLLFGLGEVEIGLEAAVVPGGTVGAAVEIPTAGPPRFTFSWKLEL